MQKNISLATAIEKARLDSNVPFLMCLEIEVVDPDTQDVVETLRAVRNSENVTIAGYEYTAAYFDITFKMQTNSVSTIQCSFLDYTQVLQANMQAYGGGVGFKVTFKVVNGGALEVEPEINETFQITAASCKDYLCSFQLGAPAEVTQAFPRVIMRKDFCQHRYKDPLTCAYGALQLTPIGPVAGGSGSIMPMVYQNVDAGTWTPAGNGAVCYSCLVAPTKTGRKFGIQIYDRTNTAILCQAQFVLNVDYSLSITAGTGGWEQISDGVYRIWTYKISGVTTSIAFNARIYPALYSGIYLNSNDIIAFGCCQLEAGVTQPTAYEHRPGHVKGTRNLLKASNVFSGLSDGVNDWVVFSNTRFPTLSTKWYGYSAGTLDSCDLTLDGPNGCRAHGNTINYGGYPGIQTNGVSYG